MISNDINNTNHENDCDKRDSLNGRAIAIEYYPNSLDIKRVAFELNGKVTQLYPHERYKVMQNG